MNSNSTRLNYNLIILLLLLSGLSASINYAAAQTTPVLGDPLTHIYGLTPSGEIYEMSSSNGAISKTIKNSTYTGMAASNSNALAYSPLNGKFYYFKRNYNGTNSEFVSFDPKTNTVVTLAASTIIAATNTGSITPDGKGYYTIDVSGVLSYYDIANNTWQTITNNIKDNHGMDVDSVVRVLASGDIAFDANGNLWVLASNGANFAIYKVAAPLSKTSVSQLTVTRVMPPTSVTPLNGSTPDAFAGIAFDMNGRLFISTVLSELYRLDNTTTLTYIGSLGNDYAGADLTSANFPVTTVLPVTWIGFNAIQDRDGIELIWKVVEKENKGFKIQASEDGLNWKQITFVQSVNNSGSEQSYSFRYKVSLSGIQYFRIVQVDIDGKESYSIVRSVNFTAANSEVAIYPNPAKNNLNIFCNTQPGSDVTKAQFYDLSGKLTFIIQLTKGVNNVNIAGLAAGVYIIKVDGGIGKRFTQKIIKQ